MSHEAITIDDTVYKVNFEHEDATKGLKSYYWNEDIPTNEKKRKKNKKNVVNEKVLCAEGMSQLTRMLSITERTEDNTKEFYFLLKPSAGSRKIHIVRHETQVMMNEILFVSKDHILYQFASRFVPVKTGALVTDTNFERVHDMNRDTKNQAVIFRQNG